MIFISAGFFPLYNPEFGLTDYCWVGEEAFSSTGVCIFTGAPLGSGLKPFLSIHIRSAALGNVPLTFPFSLVSPSSADLSTR